MVGVGQGLNMVGVSKGRGRVGCGVVWYFVV